MRMVLGFLGGIAGKLERSEISRNKTWLVGFCKADVGSYRGHDTRASV